MNTATRTTRQLLLASVFALVLLLSPLLVAPAMADLTADPGGPYLGVVDENVQFQATAFSDAGRIVEYRWDFGDGATASRPGATVNYKYSTAGTFNVSLIVVDIDGLTSAPATTTATIDPSTTTTTSSTTSTTSTTTTSPTSTTTTTTPPTSTTTTAPPPTTTTTPPTTTTLPGATTTTVPTTTTTTTTTTSTSTSTSTSTTAPSPSSPTTPTQPGATTTTAPAATTTPTSPTAATSPRTESTGEVLLPAEGLSATTFSLLPPAVSAGGEIALTLVLATETPGLAGLQILLGGEPLGQAVSINTEGSASGTGVGAVFTRTLPPDLTSGSYLIEIVASQQPSQVLASGTIEVVADPPDALVEPADAAPPPTGNQLPGLTVALAIGGATAVVGAGFGFSARFRRKEIVRRLSQKSL